MHCAALLIFFLGCSTRAEAAYRYRYHEVAVPATGEAFFQSTGYPLPYEDATDSGMRNWYTITAPTGYGITFNSTSFVLDETTRFCRRDYMLLYNASSSITTDTIEDMQDFGDDQISHMFCGKNGPIEFLAFTDKVMALFVTSPNDRVPGFNISVTATLLSSTTRIARAFCQEVIEVPVNGTVIIQSPNYPSHYLGGYDCYFTVKAPTGKGMEITAIDFDMEPSPTCEFDHLRFQGVDSGDSSSQVAFCGTTGPAELRSTSGTVGVHLRTDDAGGGRGFRLSATATELSDQKTTPTFTGNCDAVILVPEAGEIHVQSPSYPSIFPTSLDCSFSIIGPVGYAIKVNATDFSMDYRDGYYDDCKEAYIDIKVVNTQKNNLTGPTGRLYCGEAGPRELDIARSNILIVVMKSGSRAHGRGFSLTVEARKLTNQETSAADNFCESVQEVPATGRVLIQSPFHPTDYPPDLYCTMTVSAASSHGIIFDSEYFSLEDSPIHEHCSHDVLEFTNIGANGDRDSSLARYCGSTGPIGLQSTQNQVRITFRTDSTDNYAGFRIYASAAVSTPAPSAPPTELYATTYQDGFCDVNVTVPVTGRVYIESPGYPNTFIYTKFTHCTWIVTSDSHHGLIFDTEAFSLSWDVHCNYDHLELTEVGGAQQQLGQGRYCGSSGPRYVRTNATAVVRQLQFAIV